MLNNENLVRKVFEKERYKQNYKLKKVYLSERGHLWILLSISSINQGQNYFIINHTWKKPYMEKIYSTLQWSIFYDRGGLFPFFIWGKEYKRSKSGEKGEKGKQETRDKRDKVEMRKNRTKYDCFVCLSGSHGR